MFAKIDNIDILNLLFNEKVVITPGIRDEILAPIIYGYTYPLKVVSAIKTVTLTHEALQEYLKSQEDVTLGRGEIEAIAYCKAKKCTFVTNDIKARKLAETKGVPVISLQALLKSLWKKKLKTKEEVREIFEMIKKADNLLMSKKDEKEIFK
ncbi:MAG: hypothetical protein PVF58_18875 [Candidatus Methanofastidiosia archaeon]|jgi:predicted nucleic acid-binding protein